MSTKNIVPRGNNEGSIGTESKNWASGYFAELYVNGSPITSSDQELNTTNDVIFKSITLTSSAASVFTSFSAAGGSMQVDLNGNLVAASFDGGGLHASGSGSVTVDGTLIVDGLSFSNGAFVASNSVNMDNGQTYTDGNGSFFVGQSLYVTASAHIYGGATIEGGPLYAIEGLTTNNLTCSGISSYGFSTNGSVGAKISDDVYFYLGNSAFGDPSKGAMYFDNGLSKLRVYNGSAWETVTSTIL